jgi:hypothetical protein
MRICSEKKIAWIIDQQMEQKNSWWQYATDLHCTVIHYCLWWKNKKKLVPRLLPPPTEEKNKKRGRTRLAPRPAPLHLLYNNQPWWQGRILNIVATTYRCKLTSCAVGTCLYGVECWGGRGRTSSLVFRMMGYCCAGGSFSCCCY